MTRRYVPFLEGEQIDLCVPSEAAIADGWADWFNDAATTRFLGHGIFPNTPEKQADFLSSLQGGGRLALLICDKGGASSGARSASRRSTGSPAAPRSRWCCRPGASGRRWPRWRPWRA